MVAIAKPKFHLGRTLSTPGALAALAESGQSPAEFLNRHVMGDWGEVDSEDWKLNDQALEVGDRLLSAYRTKQGVKIWIITECDHSSTTILLPDEY